MSDQEWARKKVKELVRRALLLQLVQIQALVKQAGR